MWSPQAAGHTPAAHGSSRATSGRAMRQGSCQAVRSSGVALTPNFVNAVSKVAAGALAEAALALQSPPRQAVGILAGSGPGAAAAAGARSGAAAGPAALVALKNRSDHRLR